MNKRRFVQVDVFGTGPLLGNPLAVVLDSPPPPEHLMRLVAQWTNLSETAFVGPPSDPRADYRVYIHSPGGELSFAGHPTLGTCHAWLEAGNVPHRETEIIQECRAGLIRLRRSEHGLAFAAPPVRRSGPVPAAVLAKIPAQLGIGPGTVVDSHTLDNGVEWIVLLLERAEHLRDLRPRSVPANVAVVAPSSPGSPSDFEVRAFSPLHGQVTEDPATGALHALLADWLPGTRFPYTAVQGAAIGRDARIVVDRDNDGTTWVHGRTSTVITGTIDLAE